MYFLFWVKKMGCIRRSLIYVLKHKKLNCKMLLKFHSQNNNNKMGLWRHFIFMNEITKKLLRLVTKNNTLC